MGVERIFLSVIKNAVILKSAMDKRFIAIHIFLNGTNMRAAFFP